MEKYLAQTKMLDFTHESILSLVQERGWSNLQLNDRIAGIYDFVQNNVAFGYNESDNISASEVLRDGYGQCNTKSTLFMALLRAVGIACRFHGFTIHKKLQKGLANGLAYILAPDEIIHSWVEVEFNGKWYNLEGLILDKGFIKGLRNKFRNHSGSFCGYGMDVKDFNNLQVEWQECDTYIQKEGIVKDFGIFDSPDDFYAKYGTNFNGTKKLLFKCIVRRIMNNNVKKIRI